MASMVRTDFCSKRVSRKDSKKNSELKSTN